MFDVVAMRAAQIVDLVRTDGWSFLRQQVAFLNREAVVVEKDLRQIEDRSGPLLASNLQVVEFDSAAFLSAAPRYALPNRKLKALHYLKQGFGGFGLVRGDLVVGDMWYCSSATERNPQHIHQDLRLFGFTEWDPGCAYTFDIYVVPAERKSGVAAAFQNGAMSMLRAKGFSTAFGFYWADNLQAHWCTRVMNKWRKVKSVRVSRFLFWTRATFPARAATALGHAG